MSTMIRCSRIGRRSMVPVSGTSVAAATRAILPASAAERRGPWSSTMPVNIARHMHGLRTVGFNRWRRLVLGGDLSRREGDGAIGSRAAWVRTEGRGARRRKGWTRPCGRGCGVPRVDRGRAFHGHRFGGAWNACGLSPYGGLSRHELIRVQNVRMMVGMVECVVYHGQIVVSGRFRCRSRARCVVRWRIGPRPFIIGFQPWRNWCARYRAAGHVECGCLPSPQ